MNAVERAVDARLVQDLADEGFAPLEARLLALRGVTKENFGRFLSPSLSNLPNPSSLPGIAEAADVVLDAVSAGVETVVFGDYDCDGVCATAIIVRCLEALGARVSAFIPDRLAEGYGMSARSVERMLAEHPLVKLVITVDNGINSVSEIDALAERGVKCVVTDHHLPGSELPRAAALVDPKLSGCGDIDELRELCGAAVAFFLANQIMAEARRRGLYSGGNIGGPMLVLAGLATVTDIMPLTGVNRMLVSESLARFHPWASAGLKELYLRAARTGAPSLTVKDFGFLLGPRINAAGRMACGIEALELILSKDREAVREMARRVDGYNLERKRVETEMTQAALEAVVPGAAAQVIEIPGGHKGVAGIVASRVMERLGDVPVCVSVDGHGSARSPAWLNIRDAMEACGEFLERFGGHAAAGGFQVKEGALDAFRDALSAYCSRLAAERASSADPALCEASVVDAFVRPGDLTLEFAEWLKKLEPFGEGNPEPLFAVKGVTFAEVRPLGHEARHLQVRFRERGMPRAVWWNGGEEIERLRRDSHMQHDIVFGLVISDYGERHVEIQLQSAKPA